jgi:drug/metabolite transporter (DMT)-like permease
MNRFRADLLLLMVSAFWGFSYLLTDICLSEVGPLFLNAYRFTAAFPLALVFANKRIRGVNAVTLKYAFLIGLILFFIYTLYNFGIQNTSLSNAGFLCGLPVVITPILGTLFFKSKPEKKLLPVLVIVTIGIGLLTLNDSFTPAFGDILCIITAAAYALDILVTEKAINKPGVNAFLLGVFQLGFAGVFMLIGAVLFEKPTLPVTPGVWASLIFLSTFCSGAAFIIQSIAQQYTEASRAGVIFSTEPVFAGIVAFAVAGEVLTGRAYFGAALMIAGVFAMEIDFGKLQKPRQKS